MPFRLVQRLHRSSPRPEKKGVDRYFSMDYMGSAEFEFGALPDSLRRMRRFREGELGNVSPSGLKLPLDNPDHTDWMLGAGLDLEETYSFGSEVMKAALDESFRIQSDLGDFTYAVLSGGPDVEGVIGEDILVLSDLRNTPENNAALASARGILTERGGELAHVAVVAREMKVPLFVVPNALKAFRAGERVRLCAGEGKISVLGWGGNT